jgi:NAD(P)-dependent dehydrogenase (short-subunit alcohol dehydrogenase family)
MDPVLVVGVRGGVGAAVAEQLLQQGFSVIGAVRSADQFNEVRAASPALADLLALDMADAERTKQILVERFGAARLAGVIVCAAQSNYGSLESFSIAEFKQMMDVNATSCLAIYQACLPALRQAQGRLVLVSSYSGRLNFPFFGAYQASKFALESLGDVMRQEAAPLGVKVVLVEPGGIDTEMSRSMRRRIDGEIAALSATENERYGYLYRKFREQIHAATNLPAGADVAKQVIAAFTAPDPEPRYLVGDDTQFLIERRHSLSDREFDAFIKAL